MFFRNFFHCISQRTGLPLLRTVHCFLTSLLLLCVNASNLHAQTLPEGYELHPLGGGLNGAVSAVYAVGDDIYYGGDFTQAYNTLNGTTPTDAVANTNRIARWDGSQWHPLGQGVNELVYAIASANDGSIYVGGRFTQVTQVDGSTLAVNYIARFKNGKWSAVGSDVNGEVNAIAVVECASGGHDLYVGGDFTTVSDSSGTKTVNHLAKWDGSNWQALGAGVDNSVTSITYSKARGGLYIGGRFTDANAFGGGSTVTLHQVGFWNFIEQQWQPMASAPTGSRVSNILEMADDQRVFVSGSGVGLKRFDWASNSWTTLNERSTLSLQLMPDQQRLISIGFAERSLLLWNFSAETPSSHNLYDFNFNGHLSVQQTTAINRSGVYLGFSSVVDQYHYAARLVVPDMDGDEIANDDDNCPLINNSDQSDIDEDGVGDACDPFVNDSSEWLDTDNDGVGNNADICPNDQDDNCLANPVVDFDGDGVVNGADEFPDDATKWRDGDVAERLGDAAKQNFGQVVVNLGDINNDYADDYAIGTPNFKAPTQVNGKTKLLNKAGKVEVISGKTGDELLSLTGSAAKALLGSAIVAADFDRDGLIDIAIGSPGVNKNSGEVVICLAQEDGGFACTNTITPDASFKSSLFGVSLAVAELESTTQLFVGAPKAKNADKKTVGAVVRYENDNFTNPEARFGLAVNGESGAALAWLPKNELLAIGAPKANKTGEVALWDVLNDEFAAPLTGITANEGFGRKLAVGSLADGVEHLAVAAPLAANGKLKQAGRVDVFDLAASNQSLKSFVGTSKGEQLGASLAVDDKYNLFAGSPNFSVAKTASSKAIQKAGKVSRFILADDQAQDEIAGTEINQQFGASLAAIELTGDFKLDLLVGSIGANDPADKKLKAAGKLELINANDWPQ